MNPRQPADGQRPATNQPAPGRPIDPNVPMRPTPPLQVPQQRPALDGFSYRSAPAVRRPALDQTQPPVTPQPIATPPQVPRPQLTNYQSVQSLRPAPPATTYSNQAMLPGETPQEYRSHLQEKAAAEQQHAAETETILQRIPPPVEVPPKPVSSRMSFGRRSSELFGKIAKTAGSVAVFFGLVWGGAAVLNAFVFQSYYVDGLSMQPALGDNDRLIISKLERTKSQIENNSYIPERGQIIVIDGKVSDYTEQLNEQLIKRVVGLPGDTVIIQNGTVTIKNETNPDGFNVDKLLNLTVDPTFTEQPLIVTVPEDHVFVLGDNRSNGGSFDSRAFGPVPSEMILGRLWARILPTERAGVF